MKNFNRRAFLACGLLGTQALLAACGGGGGEAQASPATDLVASPTLATTAAPDAPTTSTASTTPITPTAPSVPGPVEPTPAPSTPLRTWDPNLRLLFSAGVATLVNLAETLPAGIAAGGVFGLDGTSTPLPAGVLLAPSGLLSVTAAAVASVSPGLVFSYTLP